MALDRADEAAALLARHDLEQPVGDLRYWNRYVALERARVAVVSGRSGAGTFEGPLEVRALVRLMSLIRRHPSAMMLRPLRAMVRDAEAQQHDDQLLLLFLKARVEHDTGNALQARRTVGHLLGLPALRERIGSLASLAPALQPMFGEALRALLADPAQRSEALLRLAGLSRVTAPPPATARDDGGGEALSAREKQIGEALLEGLSNRQIAERVHLSEQTVRWHLWKLFQKLGVRNRLGAAQLLAARHTSRTATPARGASSSGVGAAPDRP